MKEKEEKMYFPKVTVGNFFSTQKERDAEKLEKVQIIPVNTISNFPNHPYQVRDDEEMKDMADNVKENGVIHPIIVRSKQDGGYEIISGHRRKRACEKAGIREIPAIVREMTDEEAIIQMVDSNKQREKVLPSEKAFAYKMRLEAMKRQAGRPKKEESENSVPTAQDLKGKTSREILGEEVGESQDQVRRYIRLTELIPEMLKLVDEEQMKLRSAVEISYLKKEEQEYLLETIQYTEAFPSHPQARKMKKLSEEGKLTEDEIDEIMSQEKANQIPKIKLNEDRFLPILPKNLKTAQQREDYIFHCVEEVRKKEIRQKEYGR